MSISPPIVLASPPVSVPRPPLDAGWDRIEMWLVDRHGQRWNVSNWRDSGTFFMQGVKGMEHPKLVHQQSQNVNTDGARWNGLLVEPRDVWWPTYLYSDTTSVEYLDYTTSWWDALDPWHEVDWYVRAPNGQTRRLTVRVTDPGDPGSVFDDVYYGWAKYGITGVAHDPYWHGETVTAEFTNALPVPFFGPDGNNGPPFRPSRNTGTSTARITNPGNVSGYLTWRLVGPIAAGAELGFGSYRIDVPFEVADGQTLVIDTSPEQQTAVRNGTDVTGLMDERFDTDPIAAGQDIPLTVTFGGLGTVFVDLDPRFWRAYA